MAKKSQDIVFHSFLLKEEYFSKEKVKVVYFPKEIYTFFQRFQQGFENEFKISAFRKLKMGLFPEIISSHYGMQSLNGTEPWMYVGEQFVESDLQFIEHELVLWIEHIVKEKYPSQDLPSTMKSGQLLSIKEIAIKDVFHTDTCKTFFEGYFAYHFAKQPVLVPQYYHDEKEVKNKKTGKLETKVVDKTFELPTTWYHVFSNEKHEVLSETIHIPIPRAKKEHYASYVLHIDVVKEQGVYKLFLSSSLRRWFTETCHALFRKTRSVYLRFKHSPLQHFVRFNLYTKDKQVDALQQAFILRRINSFSPLPSAKEIMENPSDYHNIDNHDVIALIPYQLEDKGAKNPLQSGVSIWGKKGIFETFQATFPYLEQAETPRIVNTLKTSLDEGTVFPYVAKKPLDITIELWTKNTAVLPYLHQVLEKLNEKTTKFYGKRKDTAGFFTFNQTSATCYELLEVDTNQTIGSLTFVPIQTDYELLQSLHIRDKKGNDSETLKRMKLIKDTLPAAPKARYSLVEIPAYDERAALQDPKKSIQLGFLETKRITQFFHPVDPTAEKESQIIGRLGSALMDIFVRCDLNNQLMKEYAALFSKHVFYCPLKLVGKAKDKKQKYIYILTKFEDGQLFVKYTNTTWLSLADSLLYLTKQNKEQLFQEYDLDFVHFIEETIKKEQKENAVIIFEKKNLPPFYKDVLDGSATSAFTICSFDYDEASTPYISNEINGMPSHGSFLVESNNVFYSVAPKTPMMKKLPIYATENESNELFSKRRTGKLMCNQTVDDSLFEALHLFRNVFLTYTSFVNKPYPLHCLRYHEAIMRK